MKNLLVEFFSTVDGNEFDEYKPICLLMAKTHCNKKKRFLSTKDEIQDLHQDCILAFIETAKQFNPKRGKFVGLYKYKLKTLEQSFVSSYLGIGLSYADWRKEKDDFRLEMLPLYDEYIEKK